MSQLITEYNTFIQSENVRRFTASFCKADPQIVGNDWANMYKDATWVDVSDVLAYSETFAYANVGKPAPMWVDPMPFYTAMLCARYRNSSNGILLYVLSEQSKDGNGQKIFSLVFIRVGTRILPLKWIIRGEQNKPLQAMPVNRNDLLSVYDVSDLTIEADDVQSWADHLYWCIAFMTARNGRLVDEQPSRAQRRHAIVPPGMKFTHITIDPMRDIRRTGQRGNDEALVPWHKVRGHWAYYSKERPMFGRPGLHGRYWVSEHERGDRANGEVHKTYSVLPAPLHSLEVA